MINPAAILALLGELYAQVAELTEQNKQMGEQMRAAQPQDGV